MNAIPLHDIIMIIMTGLAHSHIHRKLMIRKVSALLLLLLRYFHELPSTENNLRLCSSSSKCRGCIITGSVVFLSLL